MMTLMIGYLLVVAIWTFYSIRSLLMKQKRKEAAIYGALMGISCLIGCLLLAQVDVPSLIVPFNAMFKPIGKIVLKH